MVPSRSAGRNHQGEGNPLFLHKGVYHERNRHPAGFPQGRRYGHGGHDLSALWHFIPYVFGKARNLPPQGRLNAGEKLHHALIILGFLAISVSGLVLWLWADIPAETRLVTLLVHDAAMLVLALLTIGHVFFVFVYGAFAGMWNGSVTEAYARLEHPKWLARMQAD